MVFTYTTRRLYLPYGIVRPFLRPAGTMPHGGYPDQIIPLPGFLRCGSAPRYLLMRSDVAHSEPGQGIVPTTTASLVSLPYELLTVTDSNNRLSTALWPNHSDRHTKCTTAQGLWTVVNNKLRSYNLLPGFLFFLVPRQQSYRRVVVACSTDDSPVTSDSTSTPRQTLRERA